MPIPKRKRQPQEQQETLEPQEDSGVISDVVEEVADLGAESLLEGIVNMAASAGGAVLDAAGSVAESAVEIVADAAGSALDGL